MVTHLAFHLRPLMVIGRGFSIMELAALLSSRTERIEATSVVAPVEKLQVMAKWGLDRDQCNIAVEPLEQQCVKHSVGFTVQHIRDMNWTDYG